MSDERSAKEKPEGAADPARLATISKIASTTEYYLLDTLSTSYFTIDTVFLSRTGLSEMWKWLDKEMRPLVEATRRVSYETDPHRFHRLLLVPRPDEIANTWDRESYRQLVKAVLHFHLWNGVVCHVVFVSRERYSFVKLLKSVDFGAVDRKLVFDTSRFYEVDFVGMTPMEGEDAQHHVRKVLSLIDGQDLKNASMLYYDPATFEMKRRKTDSQWERTRQFLYSLYGGKCQGTPDCQKRGTVLSTNDANVDHILAQGESNNVVLNLRLLCGACNRHKGRADTREMPYDLTFAAIPERLATTEIRRIMSDRTPSWVARYKRPPKNELAAVLRER